MLVLRTPGEIVLAYLVACSLGGVGQALLRSLGLMRAVVATVPWTIDLGVELAGLCLWAVLLCWLRSRNDARFGAEARPA